MAYSGAFHLGGPPREELPPAPPPEPGPGVPPPRSGPRLPFDLGAILKKTEAAGLEADDLLMALILFLMYRESGDIDLLIMLGVMLLT